MNKKFKEDSIMLKRLQGFIIGVIICSLAVGGIAHASPTTRTLQARFNNIRVVVDGTEIHPRDAAGNRVEPFIIDGTTYLPVRAVGDAVGKAVYWDGPNFTVYLGNMDGRLAHPTLRLQDATNITSLRRMQVAGSTDLTDNYGNRYGSAMGGASHIMGSPAVIEALMNMNYSSFKGTLYIRHGESSGASSTFTIVADGRTLYASPEMTKTSPPVMLDVNVTGYNHITLSITGNIQVFIGDAGFYQ
jgi:hypothetical protein